MAECLALRQLLNGPMNRTIAVQQGQVFNLLDLQKRVQCWQSALAPEKGVRWAVYHNDIVEFLAIILALWQLQRIACVPGDNRPGTAQRLAQTVDGFVGDFVSQNSVSAAGNTDTLSANKQWLVPAADFPALEIYTSGSTGQPKPILKTFQQIESEVESLEAQWPNQPNSVVLATVSHQHLYGMTFRLFWPLANGRPFERTLCEYTEDVFHQAVHYDRFSLVSSPSHLGRMNTSVDWASLASSCDYVVSSAAPLNRADSLNVSALLNAPVREIYGSSETGAIAWRCQYSGSDDASWQTLPGVVFLRESGESVRLTSPYLGHAEGAHLDDQLRFNDDGSFRLEGRLDSIVKVEGKRVSLREVERQLLTNALIRHAKALTVERKRTEVAVVVVLSDEGKQELQCHGRKALIKTFKTQLAEHFEAVSLPRRWRFVMQMPYNTQGKLPLEALKNMFKKEPVKWPIITSEQRLENEASLECDIPSELIYFDGHFSGNPILPGIVQVHWAEAFGRRLLPLQGSFTRLENIKFQRVIVPASRVVLNLRYDEVKQKLSFEYRSEKGIHSNGRICFE